MPKFTHSVMPHSLAKALMDSAVQHFDAGGMVAPAAPVEAMQGAGAASTGSGRPNLLGSIFGQNDYSAQLAPTQTSNYGNVINQAAGQALSGFDVSNDIRGQQQNLANALLAQTQGQGPNPAQAALAQQTGNNAAMQAALMASQRGSSANVGQLARQAAEQGGNMQQQATGQAATLQAQQQIAAQQQLAAQQQAMQSGNLGQQAASSALFGTGAGAQNAQNNSSIANYGMAQGINSKVAQENADNGGSVLGNIFGGASSFLGLGAGAKKAHGGVIDDPHHHVAALYHPEYMQGRRDFRDGGTVDGKAKVSGDSPKNDTVPAVLSPQEVVLPRTVTQSPDAPQKAADFVRHLQATKKLKNDDIEDAEFRPSGKQNKSLKERIEKLEKLYGGGAA